MRFQVKLFGAVVALSVVSSLAPAQQPAAFAPYVGTWDYAVRVTGSGLQRGRIMVRADGQCAAAAEVTRTLPPAVPCGFDGQGLKFNTLNSRSQDMEVTFRISEGKPSGQIHVKGYSPLKWEDIKKLP